LIRQNSSDNDVLFLYFSVVNDFFLRKLKSLKDIPNHAIFVTMDVSSLYTNIDHDEGAEACFRKPEMRKNKTIPSSFLLNLIQTVLKSNIFRFQNKLYRQIKGTAMGTPMAPNYANLFMDCFETDLLHDFYVIHGYKPMTWLRYIDDVFFIWTNGEDSLKLFLDFAQNYSTHKKMKSKIKFEIHQSNETVNFLDVTIIFQDKKLKTTIYSKPTNAHLYLNVKSCHPEHIIKNLCSETPDFMQQANKYLEFFINRGYDSKRLKQQVKEVLMLNRNELLEANVNKNDSKKDPQTIFVTTWHPKLKNIYKIFKENQHIIQNNDYLKNIFPSIPIAAFRRKKSVANYVVRSDILSSHTKVSTGTKPCNKCKKICNMINQDETLSNITNARSMKIVAGGDCHTKNVIYAARCKIHGSLYIGHTGEALKDRVNKHRYDANKRPQNNELATHVSQHNHDFDKDIDFCILKKDITNEKERILYEDKFICQLGTIQPTGLNIDIGSYGHEMYEITQVIQK